MAGRAKDKNGVTIRCRDVILEQGFWADADARGHVVHFLNKWRSRLETANVDSIGIGYNFGMHLRDLGFLVKLINVSDSSQLRAISQSQGGLVLPLRERLQKGQVKGLSDERTISQLAQIR